MGVGNLKFTLDPNSEAIASDFFEAGSHLLDLLDTLSDIPVSWKISNLVKSSAIVEISPGTHDLDSSASRDAGYKAFNKALLGLIKIEDGLEPLNWNPDSISIAKRLVNSVQPTNGVVRSKIEITGADSDRLFIEITDSLVLRMNSLSSKERILQGSVRGRLVGFSVSRGNRASLRLSGGSIAQVKFTNYLQESMKNNLLFDVELEGTLKKDIDDVVFWIHADSITKVTKPNKADVERLFGSVPNLTGGLSVEDYLKSIRE